MTRIIIGVLLGFGALCLLGSLIVARAQERVAQGVIVTHDIAYFTGDADAAADPVRHALDLYAPEGVANFPVLIFWHGGVWSFGSKDEYANIGAAFAARGIGVVIANYRLSPRVSHPAHVEDAARAVAWVVEHIAEYGGDPTQIVLSGHSAGGHLASLLALDPTYLAAHDLSVELIAGVVSYSGVYVIDDWIMSYAASGAFPDDAEQRAAAAPLALAEALPPVSEQDAAALPPFLLLVSEFDYPELIAQQNLLETAFTTGGGTVSAYLIPDRDHFGLVSAIGRVDDAATEIVAAWLDALFTGETETDG